jgi:hypothetical protein
MLKRHVEVVTQAGRERLLDQLNVRLLHRPLRIPSRPARRNPRVPPSDGGLGAIATVGCRGWRSMLRGDHLEPTRSGGVREGLHLRPPRQAQEVLAQAFIDLTRRETACCFALLARVAGKSVLAAGELQVPVRLHEGPLPGVQDEKQQGEVSRGGSGGTSAPWRL